MLLLAWGGDCVLLVGVALAGVKLDVVVGVVRFVPPDVLQDAACVGCAAGAS